MREILVLSPVSQIAEPEPKHSWHEHSSTGPKTLHAKSSV
jgi:hypothetical protein